MEKVVKEHVSAFDHSGGSSQSRLQILWIIIIIVVDSLIYV